MNEGIVAQDDGMKTSSPSQSSSMSSSPLLDPVDRHTGAVVRGQGSTTCSELQPGSSISSLSSLDVQQEHTQPRLSHLDILTQQDIDLDLAKPPPLDPDIQAEIV